MEHLLAEQTRIIRFYRWALEEARREATSNYPLARLVFDAPGATHWLPPSNFTKEERIACGSALVKHRHISACQLIDDPITELEASVYRKYSDYLESSLSERVGQAIQYMQHDGELAVYKMTIKRAIAGLEPLYGTRAKQIPAVGWRFTSDFGDWQISTYVSTKAKFAELEYFQMVIRRDDPLFPGTSGFFSKWETLGCTRLTHWLGIGPWHSSWFVGYEKDVQPAIDALIKCVTYFMKNAPALLEGLDI